MKEPRPVISRSVLELARKVGDGAVSLREDRRGRERLEEAIVGERRPVSRAWVPVLLAAVIGACVLALPVLRIRFSVTGAEIADNGSVRASDGEPASIVFTDGTRVDVQPGALVRVVDAGLRGADLVQERGRATYAVVHRPAAAWSVGAGPYHVRVTGTRFSVTWSPATEELVTELYEGSVIVDGPRTGAGVPLRAGQRLRVTAAGPPVVEELDAQTGAGSLEAPPPVSPSDSAPMPPVVAPTARSAASSSAIPTSTASPPAAPASAATASLAARLARGEGATIAAEIEQEGVASFASRASAADLALGADALRYANKSALANQALQALRARFPGTKEAALAAFHLGRAAEGQSPAAALGWYDTYLSEAGGGGALALEARGRKMALVARTAGNEAARPLAEAYLAQSPGGPHAALARSILASQ